MCPSGVHGIFAIVQTDDEIQPQVGLHVVVRLAAPCCGQGLRGHLGKLATSSVKWWRLSAKANLGPRCPLRPLACLPDATDGTGSVVVTRHLIGAQGDAATADLLPQFSCAQTCSLAPVYGRPAS